MSTMVPFGDVFRANVSGYELRTIDDFRDMIAGIKQEFQHALDIPNAVQAEWAEQRLDALVRLIPRARFVLWKRDEEFITVSQTVESLQAEFPCLKREKVTR